MNRLVPPDTLIRISKALTEEVLVSYAVVKLYEAEEGSSTWNDLALVGVLCVTQDKEDTMFMRLYDSGRGGFIWSFEMYMNFSFLNLEPGFFAFESDRSSIGILLAEGQNHGQFIDAVNAKLRVYQKAGSSRRQSSDSPKQQQQPKKSFFGRMKEKLLGGPVEPKPVRREVVISGVKEFSRGAHIGFDPDKGFVYENLPTEWKQLFDASGVDKAVLENPETASVIMKEMNKFANKLDGTKKPSPPPHPPTSEKNNRRMPPPPPSDPVTDAPMIVTPPPPPPPRQMVAPPVVPTHVSNSDRTLPPSCPPPLPPSGPVMGIPPPPPPPMGNFPAMAIKVSETPAEKKVPYRPQSLPDSSPNRNDLLAQIRNGGHKAKLKSVDASHSVNIDLQKIDENDKKDLVSCIQHALLKIRKDVNSDSDESSWDSD